MAKDNQRPSRIEDLARDLYLTISPQARGKTLTGIAEEAFASAEAFYAVADARRTKEQ